MKLAFKLVAIILVEIVVLLAVDGYLAVQREIRLYQTDMQRDATLIGHALKNFVAETWKSKGEQRALQLLEQANDRENLLRIRWVWRDGSDDLRFRPMASDAALAAVAGRRDATIVVVDRNGERFFCTYVAVDVPSPRPGAIELSEPLSQLNAFTQSIALRNTILAAVLIAAAAATVTLLGYFVVGRPLNRLAEKARRVGKGDLSASLDAGGHDELSELARSMNDMCRQLTDAREQTRIEQQRRIAAIEQLRHADRLRTAGRLTAGIAHELGTPLNTISIRAGMIAEDNLSASEISENANIVKSECGRMTGIIQRLLDYARPRPPRRASTDLRQAVRDTISMLAPLSAKHNGTITIQEDAPCCTAVVDTDQIRQVVTNLIVNALQATSKGVRIGVGVTREHATPPAGQVARANGEFIRISVNDNGPGISEENLRHVFEPFFTTKDVGEGTGLGLSIAYGIVQEHGGWIDVTSRPGRGSCFSVYLPVQ